MADAPDVACKLWGDMLGRLVARRRSIASRLLNIGPQWNWTATVIDTHRTYVQLTLGSVKHQLSKITMRGSCEPLQSHGGLLV